MTELAVERSQGLLPEAVEEVVGLYIADQMAFSKDAAIAEFLGLWLGMVIQ